MFLALTIHIVTPFILSDDVFHIAKTHCPIFTLSFADIIFVGVISFALFQF
jgi:hypothetical protein